MTTEDRLRRALADSASAVPSAPERWDEIEQRANATRIERRRRRSHWRNGGLAAAGLAAAVILATVLPGLGQGSGQVQTHPLGHESTETTDGAGPAGSVPAGSVTPRSVPPGSVPPGSVPAHTTVSAQATSKPAAGFSYQPLWPFRSLADANSWLASYRGGGHQPWHTDPAQTALSFSRGYLGYQNVNAAYDTSMDAAGAHVTVGFANPNGQPVKAAIVHLRQFGTAADAPWEVVGTDDADFSLMTPKYGSVVTSPITAGGLITGVDESIMVRVLQPSSSSPLGQTPGLATGGVASPWTTPVSFRGATDGVITVAASTGGHLAAVERFTVTGVRTSSGPPTAGL